LNELKAEIARKKSELDRLRPAVTKSLAALNEWYDVELTYTSNAIEGNTLTRIETAVVLEKGLTIGGKPLKDHLEVIGHKDALEFIRSIAQKPQPVHEVDVRAIHRLVLERTDPREAGKYSDHERVIKGSSAVLPSPWEIAALMTDFGRWLSTAAAGPESAFEAHLRLVLIHPFSDGNGRTARLLMNLLLIKDAYPPVIIGPEHRTQYVESLETAQAGSNREPYEEFMYRRLEASLDRHLEFLGRKPPHTAVIRSAT
jgi:Fic family protein